MGLGAFILPPGAMYPLVLNLHGRLAVVIGGGPVGRRKAAALVEAGARVRLVCREPRPADGPAVEWLAGDYRPDHLDGAALVFAAGPAEVNRRVVADARARGLWVNDAHDPDAGDFLVPAVVRRGDFLLAVSTGGAAPLLARAVCARLEPQFDEAFGRFVALLAELRPVVLAEVADADRRRRLFEDLCRGEWLERLRAEGPDAVRRDMTAAVRTVAERDRHRV